MNKNDNMYGESREQENEMQNNPRTNANTNDLDSRSNSGDTPAVTKGVPTSGSSRRIRRNTAPRRVRTGKRKVPTGNRARKTG